MPDVALDIFEAVTGGASAHSADSLPGARFVYNGALDALRRKKDAASAVSVHLT